MFYEFECLNCNKVHTIRRPMSEAGKQFDCPECGIMCARLFSSPRINMNEVVSNFDGTDYRRTNEPPDELKPDTWHFRNERETHYGLISYPNQAAKRVDKS